MKRLSAIAPLVVCGLLYVAAGIAFPGFFGARVFFNFISDNAFLGIVAVGLTWVILTGGIDLSVGAMVGCSGIMLAKLMQGSGPHPFVAVITVLAFGGAVGTTHGWLIHRFKLPPFLVTLGGLFFCRGLALWISKESVQIDQPAFLSVSEFKVALPAGASLPAASVTYLLVLAAGALIAGRTIFGRTLYAIGASEQSAEFMGLPVGRTKIGAYCASGLCGALGGIVFSMYTASGNALSGSGLELDAIAAVVIGGTRLSGGYGSVLGSAVGILILGIIQTAITFQGSLSSWWTKIAIGVLLLAFLVLQKGLEHIASGRGAVASR